MGIFKKKVNMSKGEKPAITKVKPNYKSGEKELDPDTVSSANKEKKCELEPAEEREEKDEKKNGEFKLLDKKKTAEIFSGYNQSFSKLEEEIQKKTLVMKNLEMILKSIDQLDKDLSNSMQTFWIRYSPKLRTWLLFVRKKILEFPGKIQDLRKKAENYEDPLKPMYQNLIDRTIKREKQWRKAGMAIIVKILFLKEITDEIVNFQDRIKVSNNKFNNIVVQFKTYESDLKKTLKEEFLLKDFENRVQGELDKAIVSISPVLLDLINKRIMEDLKSIVPRAEILFSEADSFKSLVDSVGTEFESMTSSQDKILKTFQQCESFSLDVKLTLNKEIPKLDVSQFDQKVDEMIEILSYASGVDKSVEAHTENATLKNKEGKSYTKFLEIIKEMGRTNDSLEEVIVLLKDKNNDFKSNELEDVFYNFPERTEIRLELSKFKHISGKTLVHIIAWGLGLQNDQTVLSMGECDFFERFSSEIFQNAKKEQTPGRIIYYCIRTFLLRSKISRKVFDDVVKMDDIGLIVSALKNPKLESSCFYYYQDTDKQDLIKALAMNSSTPTQVINHLVKRANKKNLDYLSKNPNATSFTHELIERR